MQRAAGKDRVEGIVFKGYGISGAKEVFGAVGESQFPRVIPGYRDHVRAYVKTDEAGIPGLQQPVQPEIAGPRSDLQRTSTHAAIEQKILGLKPSLLPEICLHPVIGFGIGAT